MAEKWPCFDKNGSISGRGKHGQNIEKNGRKMPLSPNIAWHYQKKKRNPKTPHIEEEVFTVSFLGGPSWGCLSVKYPPPPRCPSPLIVPGTRPTEGCFGPAFTFPFAPPCCPSPLFVRLGSRKTGRWDNEGGGTTKNPLSV